MAERIECEFQLVRYVPDVVKGEFVNIGVLLREPGRAPAVRFTRDWSRVRCVDADADVDLLEALEGEIADRLRRPVDGREPKPVLELLEDTLSNSVQLTESQGTLAETGAAEMDGLMRMYVEPLRVQRSRTKSGRTLIAGAMRTEFERAGVWAAMRKRIRAAGYTRPGDPLQIDCGYRADRGSDGAAIRMFQAVSLASDAEAAKGLAYSAGPLGEGVRRVEGVPLELTAVVEPLRTLTGFDDDEEAERYRFGVETMERAAMRVVTLADLARAAVTARREMGL